MLSCDKKDNFVETTIYALTDSHQEARNLSHLLSGIYCYEIEKETQQPFLILDAGDLFKGIYDKELSINAYLKIKKLLPKAQIFITVGNNDFGFKKADFEDFKKTVQNFKDNGINVVCANIYNSKTQKRETWIDEYKILEINNRRILITGFCLNNSCAKKFGCELITPEEGFEKIITSVKEEYDNIIVLNHHWYPNSKKLKEFAIKKLSKNIDLIIGGHEHSFIKPDFENNIFYPRSFARGLYKMKLDKEITEIQEILKEELEFIEDFKTPIIEYEKKTKLKEPIIKRVLDLKKSYSEPCPLGTFISDNMKKIGKTDIAFHSTGFTMASLELGENNTITKYDFEKVICAATTLEKIELTTEELKKVFENATSHRMFKDRGNARFLQCSQNIKITGKGNSQNHTYEIRQIEINGEKLLDEAYKPIDKNRRFTCTIDTYIGTGEQGFDILKNLPKVRIKHASKEIKINELFFNALLEAEETYDKPSQYPSFQIIDE